MTSIPNRRSSTSSPIPDCINTFGVLKAPCDKITSTTAEQQASHRCVSVDSEMTCFQHRICVRLKRPLTLLIPRSQVGDRRSPNTFHRPAIRAIERLIPTDIIIAACFDQ